MDLLDASALKDVATDDQNAVYDRRKAKQSAGEQQLNKHQQRKEDLQKALKSKAKLKKEKTDQAKRVNREKYKNRNETVGIP